MNEKEAAHIEGLRASIRDGDDMQLLLQSAGWKILAKSLMEKQEALLCELMALEKDGRPRVRELSDFVRIQQRLVAMNQICTLPKYIISIAAAAVQELENKAKGAVGSVGE